MPLLKTDMQPCIRWDWNVVFPVGIISCTVESPKYIVHDTRTCGAQLAISGTMDEEIQSATCQDDSPEPDGLRLRTGSCATWVSALLRTTILRPPLSPESAQKKRGKCWAPPGNLGCHQQLPSWDGINPKTELADDGRTTTCLGAKVEQFVLGNGLGQKPKGMENVGK